MLAPDAQAKLLAYDWPGNVRELDNVIQRALILSDGLAIDAELLMLDVAAASAPASLDVMPTLHLLEASVNPAWNCWVTSCVSRSTR